MSFLTGAFFGVLFAIMTFAAMADAQEHHDVLTRHTVVQRNNDSYQSWVQREADMQASRNRMGHIQRCPAGFRAGVGFSTVSADSAIRNCCYWNRPSRERWFHVSRGARGWYAAALYR